MLSYAEHGKFPAPTQGFRAYEWSKDAESFPDQTRISR